MKKISLDSDFKVKHNHVHKYEFDIPFESFGLRI